VQTCYTNYETGVQDAMNCWNQQLLNGQMGALCYAAQVGGAASSVLPSAVPSVSEVAAPLSTSVSEQKTSTTKGSNPAVVSFLQLRKIIHPILTVSKGNSAKCNYGFHVK